MDQMLLLLPRRSIMFATSKVRYQRLLGQSPKLPRLREFRKLPRTKNSGVSKAAKKGKSTEAAVGAPSNAPSASDAPPDAPMDAPSDLSSTSSAPSFLKNVNVAVS